MGIFRSLFGGKKQPDDSTGGARFKEKHSEPGRRGGTNIYEVWTAPSAQAAKQYLNTRTITERQYYLVVETPEGTWGKDINGVYNEDAARQAS